MAAEGLAGGPLGVEATEDVFAVVGRDARAVVVDAQLDTLADALDDDDDDAAIGRERDRVVDEVAQYLRQPAASPSATALPGSGAAKASSMPRGSPARS